MSFSERLGIKPIKVEIQKDYIDQDLRVGLWNIVYNSYFNTESILNVNMSDYEFQIRLEKLYLVIWVWFFKRPIDEKKIDLLENKKYIKEWFFNAEWYRVYDFLEFIVNNFEGDSDIVIRLLNFHLETQLSAYRFVNRKIVEVTDSIEIEVIEHAIEQAHKKEIQGVKAHLVSALGLMSDKKSPDYRNSIKESISAIEAICGIILKDDKITLGKALKKIEKEVPIHEALKKSFEALYGYTSDGDGIRHAMLKESNLSFEDAKYMIVSCSAFVNYLIVKAEKNGLDL